MKLWLAPSTAVMLSMLQPAAAHAQSAPQPYVIVVAPGHGGEDPGAIFPPDSDNPTVAEKDLTLAIGLKLRDRLSRDAVRVVMTRTSDLTTTAEERAALADRVHANAFISVHVNSYFADRSVRGAETQFFSDPRLAEDVTDGLAAALSGFDETVRTTKDREEDNILSMPGAIVEAGYLSNPADRLLLQTDGYQSAVADGIYRGLLRYAPEIQDIKTQIQAYEAARATVPAPAPAAKPAAQPGPRVPGWALGAGLTSALGLALLAARGRSRRRYSRRSLYPTVVRYR